MPIAAPGRVAEPDACPICLTDLQHRGGRAIVESGCGHAMHYRCFGRLLESDALATCPMCRQQLGLSPSGNTPAAGPPPAPRAPPASRADPRPEAAPPILEDDLSYMAADWWETAGTVFFRFAIPSSDDKGTVVVAKIILHVIILYKLGIFCPEWILQNPMLIVRGFVDFFAAISCVLLYLAFPYVFNRMRRFLGERREGRRVPENRGVLFFHDGSFGEPRA
ncbi:hypothetical protein DFJ74DRAFT_442998 [Hyaloraphidium curvatum]|nr:hypothetical protein DFJ74DRAFT_442998 [Hyaloraphidium curvatum]